MTDAQRKAWVDEFAAILLADKEYLEFLHRLYVVLRAGGRWLINGNPYAKGAVFK